MLIEYCESCQRKLTELDFAAGHAVRVADRNYCRDCGDRRRAAAEAGASSGVRLGSGLGRAVSPASGARRLVTPAAGSAQRKTPGSGLSRAVWPPGDAPGARLANGMSHRGDPRASTARRRRTSQVATPAVSALQRADRLLWFWLVGALVVFMAGLGIILLLLKH
jgi:hypothetical protein